jgi:serine/threonine protein kinase
LEAYQNCPLICKLTDFGESRSNIIQTNTLLHAATGNVQRGSLPFMAPEIIVDELRVQSASIEDLKQMDLWAMGMAFFSMLNADQPHPFDYESKVENMRTSDLFRNLVASKLRVGQRPRPSPRYEELQRTKLVNVSRMYKMLTAQAPIERSTAESLQQQAISSSVDSAGIGSMNGNR